MGTMLDETTMVLKSSDGIVSIRPEHIFLQKDESDTFLSSGSLTIRGEDKQKAILGRAGPLTTPKGGAHPGSAASLVLLDTTDSVVWQAP
jgi:hypothetical protein